MEQTAERTYRVSVGLTEYMVQCRSAKEAVEEAKARLRRQMPHLGTVIQGIREKEFQVDPVEHAR